MTSGPSGLPLVPPPGPSGAEKRGRSRSKTRLAVAGVGVGVLLGAGWFVVQGLGGESGGASSPEAAVQQLADALDSEDPAAAAAALAPDEVRTLGDLIGAVEERTGKAGVTGKDPYAGLSLGVDELDLEVDELSDTVAKVTVNRAEATVEVNRAELPERIREATGGRDTRRSLDEDDLAVEYYDQSRGRDVSIDPFVMVVERGGGWYVSPTYTLAAYLAEEQGLPEGDFEEEIPEDLKAAETPEDAVTDLVNSLQELDSEETLANLPSDEWSVLWVYRDAIEDLVDEQTSDGSSFELEVEDQELETTDLGDGYKRVAIKEASGSFSTRNAFGEEQSWDWSLDGLCFESDGTDGRRKDCLDDDAEDFVDSIGLKEPFVVVAQDRGGWVVSPTATLLQYAREIVPEVSDAWGYRLLGLEWFAPADGTAEVGTPVKGTLNDAGYAGYDVTVTDGQRVLLSGVDDDLDGIYGIDEKGDERYGFVGNGEDEPGSYRILVRGDPEGDFEFQLVGVDVQNLSGRSVSGELSDEKPMVEYRFSVSEDDVFQLESGDGDFYTEIVSEDDLDYDLYDYESGGYDLEAGTSYRLRVRSYSSGKASFAVELTEGPSLTIDGGASTTGVLDYGASNDHAVVVPAGTTALVSLASSAYDLDLSCSDGGCASSSGSGTSYETVYIAGPFDGYVTVFDYSGDGGSYDLSIRED